jgi:hypothetical protein
LLNIDDYTPEITKQTYPLIRYYADKIGAEIEVISERKFQGWPPVYEKLQIFELAQRNRSEWHIYIDSDAVIHPETPDFTQHIDKDTVLHNGSDQASLRWTYDKYFLRDGRNIGACNWFTVASEWCTDLWQPLDIPLNEAILRIHPTLHELHAYIEPGHLIDDYTLSRNIARYGLKFETVKQLCIRVGLPVDHFFWHAYTITTAEKIDQIKKVLDSWKLPDAIRYFGM